MRPALVLCAALLVAGCGVPGPAGAAPAVTSSVATDELTLDVPELL